MAAYSTSEVIIAGNGVVIAMPDPRIATTTANSTPTWVQTLKGCGHHPVAVVEAGDLVLAGTHGHLWALDRATGEAVWKSSRSDNRFSRSPVAVAVYGDMVIGANNNYVVARDLATGDLIWRTMAHVKVMASAAALLVTSDGMVVHGSSGRITALRSRDGHQVWTTFLGEENKSTPVTICECPGMVGVRPASFLVGARGYIYELHKATGHVTCTTSLAGTGWKMVTIMMHPTDPAYFFAATSGQVTLHRASTHAVIAKNNLKGCYYGRSLGLAWCDGIAAAAGAEASASSAMDLADSIAAEDEVDQTAPPPPYDATEEADAPPPSYEYAVGLLDHLYRDSMSTDDDDFGSDDEGDGWEGEVDDGFESTKTGPTLIVTIGRYIVGLRPDNLETKYKANLGIYQRLAPSVLVDPATGLAHVASTAHYRAFEATSGALVCSINVSGVGGRTGYNTTMAVGGVSTDTNLVPRFRAI